MLVRGLHDRGSGDGRGGGGGGGPFAAACQAGVALADEVAAAGFDQRVRLPDVDALMRAMVSEHRHLIGFIIAINTMTDVRVG